MNVDELARHALLFPDDLWAWLGPLKADRAMRNKTGDGGMMWRFKWKFKKAVSMPAIEYIVNHELMHVEDDHPWMGTEFGAGMSFECTMLLATDGTVREA